MLKRSKTIILSIGSIFLLATSMFLIINYNRKLELIPIKEEVEPLLMNYYSLLDKKEWSKAKELLFIKEENLWFNDELENIWGLINISTKEIVEFEKVTTDLYSTKISMEIFYEELNYSETVEVHPFIAKIDSEFKIIINKRDIPSQFGIECNPDEIIILESAQ